MRSNLVVLTPELLDQNLRIDPILEPLHAQTLVAELAVERFVRAVLPRLARIDVGGVDVRDAEPQLLAGLEFPWDLAFLPNGDMLVTERSALRLRVIRESPGGGVCCRADDFLGRTQ